MRYAIDIRIKNAEIASAVLAHGSQAALAAACGVHQSDLSALATLKRSPWSKRGKPILPAKRIAEYLGLDFETTFPAALYGHFVGQETRRVHITESNFLPLRTARMLAAPDDKDLRERKGIVAEVVSSLPQRTAEVLRQRYGLDGDGERTCAEIAKRLNLSPQRIRQIEVEALRKLRKPSLRRRLEGLL